MAVGPGASQFFYGGLQMRKIARQIPPQPVTEGTGSAIDRIGHDIGPSGGFEAAKGPRHVKGACHQHPPLARRKTRKGLCPNRVFGRVPRNPVEYETATVEPLPAQEPACNIGFTERGSERVSQTSAAAGEHGLRIRETTGKFYGGCQALGTFPKGRDILAAAQNHYPGQILERRRRFGLRLYARQQNLAKRHNCQNTQAGEQTGGRDQGEPSRAA